AHEVPYPVQRPLRGLVVERERFAQQEHRGRGLFLITGSGCSGHHQKTNGATGEHRNHDGGSGSKPFLLLVKGPHSYRYGGFRPAAWCCKPVCSPTLGSGRLAYQSLLAKLWGLCCEVIATHHDPVGPRQEAEG